MLSGLVSIALAVYCPEPAQLVARITQAIRMSHKYFLFIDAPVIFMGFIKKIRILTNSVKPAKPVGYGDEKPGAAFAGSPPVYGLNKAASP